jgi:uncharacterized membrane protein YfcA
MYVFGAILIGFVAAFLAGMFGIGGAGITTPAIRVLLDVSPAVALGTTLPVTIPTAAAGALTYYRRGFVVQRVAAYCCLAGIFGAVGGALLTRYIDLHYLMLLTGAVVIYLSATTIRRGITGRGLETEPAETPPETSELDDECAPDAGHTGGPAGEGRGPEDADECPPEFRPGVPLILGIGLAAGIFSGLLGVGGGIVLIPFYIYLLRLPLKKAFGTSLAVITVIAIPGTIVHSLLHHINWTLALYLTVGSIPGAYLGARLSIRTGERVLYVLFGLLLGGFGLVFIVNEIISMVG